jgi:hypothetical protein
VAKLGKGKVSSLAGKYTRNTCDCVKKCVAALRDINVNLGGLDLVEDEQLALVHMHANCGKTCSKAVGDALLEDVLAQKGEAPRTLTEEPGLFEEVASSLIGKVGLQRKKRQSAAQISKQRRAEETRKRARLSELELRMVRTAEEQARAQRAGDVMDDLMNRLRAGEDLDRANLTAEQQQIWEQMKAQIGVVTPGRLSRLTGRPAAARVATSLSPVAGAVTATPAPAGRRQAVVRPPVAATPIAPPGRARVVRQPQQAPVAQADIDAQVALIEQVIQPSPDVIGATADERDVELANAARVDGLSMPAHYADAFIELMTDAQQQAHFRAVQQYLINIQMPVAARDLDILPFGWNDILDRRGVMDIPVGP